MSEEEEEELLLLEPSDELRRKSCVIAMPMLAKDRLVRSQARKVRSVSVLASYLHFFNQFSVWLLICRRTRCSRNVPNAK